MSNTLKEISTENEEVMITLRCKKHLIATTVSNQTCLWSLLGKVLEKYPEVKATPMKFGRETQTLGEYAERGLASAERVGELIENLTSLDDVNEVIRGER